MVLTALLTTLTLNKTCIPLNYQFIQSNNAGSRKSSAAILSLESSSGEKGYGELREKVKNYSALLNSRARSSAPLTPDWNPDFNSSETKVLKAASVVPPLEETLAIHSSQVKSYLLNNSTVPRKV